MNKDLVKENEEFQVEHVELNKRVDKLFTEKDVLVTKAKKIEAEAKLRDAENK